MCYSVILNFVQLFVTPVDCSPARFLCPWDFPGNNIGVDCHFQPGILSYPVIELISPGSPAWQADSLLLSNL